MINTRIALKPPCNLKHIVRESTSISDIYIFDIIRLPILERIIRNSVNKQDSIHFQRFNNPLEERVMKFLLEFRVVEQIEQAIERNNEIIGVAFKSKLREISLAPINRMRRRQRNIEKSSIVGLVSHQSRFFFIVIELSKKGWRRMRNHFVEQGESLFVKILRGLRNVIVAI
jgi:hypothetical protein